MRHLLGCMFIITLVCCLGFCEPSYVKKEREIKKQETITPAPKKEQENEYYDILASGWKGR